MFSARNPANAYRRVGFESDIPSASPHRLVNLLYDGAIQAVQGARMHMEQRQVAAKGMAIGKAIRIIDEGLKASLDPIRGGDLALRLSALYDYLTLRLVTAGSANDTQGLEEVERLLQTLRDAWVAIDPEAPARTNPAPRTNLAGGLVAA